MGVRFRIINTNNNNVLASIDIPDANLPRLISAWSGGPGTPAEEALKFALRAIREETKERNVAAAEADEIAAIHTAQATLQAARATETAAFNNDFPEVT
jgi:hypothetical protein